jgi:hypothetical protein
LARRLISVPWLLPIMIDEHTQSDRGHLPPFAASMPHSSRTSPVQDRSPAESAQNACKARNHDAAGKNSPNHRMPEFDRCRDWGLQALVCGGRDRRAGTAIIFSVLGESCSNVQPSPGRFRLREPNFTLDKAIVRLPLLALASTSLFFDIEINLCCGAVSGYLRTVQFHF